MALLFYCVLLPFVSFIVRFSLRIDGIGGLRGLGIRLLTYFVLSDEMYRIF